MVPFKEATLCRVEGGIACLVVLSLWYRDADYRRAAISPSTLTMSGSDTLDSLRVLLVDDDVEFAEMYRLRLEADGYAVEWARSGREGLRLAYVWEPHLIFIDVRMPEMDGLELLRTLREDSVTAAVPVVVLTNYGDDDLRGEGERLGVLEWHSKIDVTPGGIATWIRRWSTALAEEGKAP